jgi:hypothetical protein
MAEPWMCGDCRSFNTPGASRCYRCRVPRKSAEVSEATAALQLDNAAKTQTLLARANRLGARYVATWPLALLLLPIIAIATVTNVLQLSALSALVDAEGMAITDPSATENLVRMTAIAAGSFYGGVVIWSIWIGRVLANVPALVARWPRYGWIAALLAPWIPFLNAKRPFSIVREACGQLSERANGAVLIAAVWWLCLLLSYFAPGFVSLGRIVAQEDATVLQSMVIGAQVGQFFFVPAGIFAVGLVLCVERLQRQALRRRETVVVMADGAPAPA